MDISRCAPLWVGVDVRTCAKYLGFILGPGRGDHSWDGPLKKFRARAITWGRAGIGMMMTLRAYRTYVFTVLSFVAQLAEVPARWRTIEAAALRAMFAGPNKWIDAEFLHNLSELGLPLNLPRLETMAIAAKSRVYRREDIKQGGVRIAQRSRALRSLVDGCNLLEQYAWLQQWYHGNFIFSVDRAERTVKQCIRAHRISGTLPREYIVWHANDDAMIPTEPQGSWQRVARALQTSTGLAHIRTHLDRRLRKMPMNVLPGYRTTRAISTLQRLSNKVAPRVISALLRTLCNGWCTAGRFGQRTTCKFCKRGADTLPHIARCGVVWKLMRDECGIQRPAGGEFEALCCLSGDAQWRDQEGAPGSADAAACIQVQALFATYKLHNHLRHCALVEPEMPGAFRAFFNEARAATTSMD